MAKKNSADEFEKELAAEYEKMDAGANEDDNDTTIRTFEGFANYGSRPRSYTDDDTKD